MNNIELIYDYINGNEINKEKLKELENDSNFMKEVIKITKDKKMYNLCSDNLKKDYDFTKFIINKFKEYENYICEVANKYLNNTNEEQNRLELSIIMSNLINSKEKKSKYEIIKNTIYSSDRVKIELIKQNDTLEENIINELGMGFLYFYDLYKNSEIILNFYAKEIINEIFKEYDIDLEIMLHEQFTSPEKLNKLGINNYMLSFIYNYDKMLSSYLNNHIEEMKDLKNKINIAIKNWSNYNNKEEYQKYNLMIDEVHNYMEEKDGLLTETDLLYYIGKKLGVDNKIAKYDGIDEELLQEIQEGLSEEYIGIALLNINEYRNYINVKNIMTNILFSTRDKELNIVKQNKKFNKCRILELNINKNKEE